MTKRRIKPGYDVTLPNGGRLFESNGELRHSLGVPGYLDIEYVEALAAAFADAVEDAPRELWEEAKLAHDFHAVRAERVQWQAVVDAVLAAARERER